MPTRSTKETAVGVTAFKAKCLGLIDDVARGKTGRVLLLKRNRAVAAIVPVHDEPADEQDLWGAMRGTVTVAPGVDLTDPTSEVWDAEQ